MSRLVSLVMRAAALTAVISHAGISQATSPTAVSARIFELRMASDKPAPGLAAQRNFESNQPEILYLGSESLVSDDDLVHARTMPAQNGINVVVRLSDAAAARLRETTASSIGKYMAVFGHGTFAGAAVIMSSIPNGNTVTVNLTLPAAAADSVRSSVAARWP